MAGKPPINYTKESQHQKLDNDLQQLHILPEDKIVQFNIQKTTVSFQQDTAISFEFDQWTIPLPQYLQSAAQLVPVYNPFLPAVFSTPM